MLRRLAAANAGDDPGTLDEVAGLLREIKSAWDEMPLTASTQH
jgi:flagellar secretion chaperone FliS